MGGLFEIVYSCQMVSFTAKLSADFLQNYLPGLGILQEFQKADSVHTSVLYQNLYVLSLCAPPPLLFVGHHKTLEAKQFLGRIGFSR